jgi:hypothetical protein
MRRCLIVLSALACFTLAPTSAQAEDGVALASLKAVPAELMSEALTARARFADQVGLQRYLAIIDYRLPSSARRLFLVDLETMSAESLLVAHGAGSDPEHDGVADRFSNTPDSHMSSLGAFVTGETYQGRHGLSLRLRGLEPTNDNAEARAIVFHGADYVSPTRAVLGRSWGCPALETDVAAHVINELAGGAFVYVVGNQV